eukprot:CAMPEP_0184643696 /NCGR_PEP_ID=MMETSP0308-20130426/518_1 /TAXON_ID=38269 /ORGANISM="Gloeochaete witrockiana, Strain SAG 46.84" /LENGTH=597 /DNA_ID=CAMNT_0027071793 /DNA_START=174 /DNA_END=1967 /DNA_ORIENTATION=+
MLIGSSVLLRRTTLSVSIASFRRSFAGLPIAANTRKHSKPQEAPEPARAAIETLDLTTAYSFKNKDSEVGEPRVFSVPRGRERSLNGYRSSRPFSDRPRYRSGPGSDRRSDRYSGWVQDERRGPAEADVEEDSKEPVPFEKNFYKEHEETAALTNEEVSAFREANEISVKGAAPKPTMQFLHAGFPELIHKKFEEDGFTQPTPIQAQSWPIALSGKDMIGLANTGSGKTLCFLLPAMVHLQAQRKLRRGDGPVVLVLVPTRELAHQIQSVCVDYGKRARIRSVSVYGGTSKFTQIRDLEYGAEIVIATPGRLNDLLEMGKISLKRVTFLVLDEADRMLDMGFEPQIRSIIEQVRPDRQTVMFSATWAKEVEQLARDFITEPVTVKVGDADLSANPNVKQIIEMVSEHEKEDKLAEYLGEHSEERSKVIVFSATKTGAEELTEGLRDAGFQAVSIHGDKSQNERDRALRDFKSGRHHIMVATDVVSRGLDVRDVRLVINYDFPENLESYIHRIGRTGRAGDNGTAVSFFTPRNYALARELVKLLEEHDHTVPEDLLRVARPPPRVLPRKGRTVQSRGTSSWAFPKQQGRRFGDYSRRR